MEKVIEYWREGEKYQYDTSLIETTVAGHPVQMTSFYTVADPRWGANYLLSVQEAERRVGREICAMPKQDGTPCCKYPTQPEEESYPSEIGRCEIHRPSMQVKIEVEEEIAMSILNKGDIRSQTSDLPSNPATKMILDVAEHYYMRCGNCIHRADCDDRGEDNSRCVQESVIFETIMSELIRENNLDTVADQLTALSIADTMLKIIRTSSHETRYGIIESINTGTAQYNIHLKKLLIQGLKSLGVDRKTRITVKRSSGFMEEVGGSIAKALSGVSVSEVEVRAAKLKIESKQGKSKSRTINPVGIDGEEIKDDVPLQERH